MTTEQQTATRARLTIPHKIRATDTFESAMNRSALRLALDGIEERDKRIEELESQLAIAKADSERLDWINSGNWVSTISFMVSHLADYDDLRCAIDAASGEKG